MVPQPYTRARLSDRQPGHAAKPRRPQHPMPHHLAWLASARPPDARKGTTRGAPPLPDNSAPPPPVRHAGGCMQPVLIRGRVDHIDGTTGELLHRYTTAHEPGGVLPIACKTRRATNAHRALRPTAPTPRSEEHTSE